jgi:hypothetical protein
LLNAVLAVIGVYLIGFGALPLLALYLAATELAWTIPARIYYLKRGEPELARGITASLAITVLLWGTCWFFAGSELAR